MNSPQSDDRSPPSGRPSMSWDGAECKRAFDRAAIERPWTLGYASYNEDALPATELMLEGSLPAGIRGTLFRNGPARHERGGQRYSHRWDGDGLVQAIQLDASRGMRCQARFVRTPKYLAEQQAGRFQVSAFGTHVPGSDSVPEDIDSINAANISVCMAGSNLLALWEPGSAHYLDPLTLETRGMKSWGSDLAGRPFSAHPKREPDGTLWNFGANPLTGQLTIYCIDKDGSLQRSTTLCVDDLPNLHDFAITDRHLVFPLSPILVNNDRLMSGVSFAQSCEWRPRLGTRVLVVSKADWATRLYELPASCIFHIANAWEDSSGVIRFQMMAAADPMSFLAGFSTMLGTYRHRRGALMTQVILDPHGTATQTINEAIEGEFPIVDPIDVGRKNTEVLCLGRSSARSADVPGYDEVVLFNVETGVDQRFTYGHDYLAEEHLFVPNSSNPKNAADWVVGTALDMRSKRTIVSVFRAQRIADGPIARAVLPVAFPLGLHGCYVPTTI